MLRCLAVLTLVAACGAACSQQTPPQSSGAQTAGGGAPSGAPAQTAPTQTAPTQTAATQTAATEARPAPSATASEPAAAPTPPPPPEPRFREVTIPAGTSLSVKLLSNLASDKNKVEDPVKGSIDKPVVVDGTTVVPQGTSISGSVTDVAGSGRVKGKASIGFRFDRLAVGSETHKIQTAAVKREAAADTKSDVKKGAVGTGLGAVVGGVIGGGKGAAIGAVAGGAGAVVATKGSEVELRAGTAVTVLLQEPLTLMVPVK